MADAADCSDSTIESLVSQGLYEHQRRMARREPPDCPVCEEFPVMVLRGGVHACCCTRCWEENHPGCTVPECDVLMVA